MLQPNRCYVVGEIGINHNGDVDLAKRLMDVAHAAGCDAVKFQKRTVGIVYTATELARPRESQFGKTNGDLKRGLEFDRAAYDQIDAHARALGIDWYASPWDEASVDFLQQYDIPYLKLASASITDQQLLRHCAATGRPLMISTGMSDYALTRRVVDCISQAGGEIACLYHCTSTYPGVPEELNLRAIHTLQRAFPDIPIGYSGHEVGVPTSVMAATLGAVSIERHITLDRSMPGTDQAASLEPAGLDRLVRDIRLWERARGDGVLRIYDSELPVRDKLRRLDTVSPGPAKPQKERIAPEVPAINLM
jgi:N-acetylneuraminate synthase